jgi:Protein of unknown function (DUF4232)
MTARTLVAVVAAGAMAAIAATGAASAAAGACAASVLTAKMSVIRGSAGAGNVEYRLLLRNTSGAACSVSGHPALHLLGAHGNALPTHVTPVPPGVTAALITLRPGQSAVATLRFSPDVPGKGEQTVGACERTAHGVRVSLASPGHGTLTGPILPPTPVCEHGGMTETLLSLA